jgi:hypothetical protein
VKSRLIHDALFHSISVRPKVKFLRPARKWFCNLIEKEFSLPFFCSSCCSRVHDQISFSAKGEGGDVLGKLNLRKLKLGRGASGNFPFCDEQHKKIRFY